MWFVEVGCVSFFWILPPSWSLRRCWLSPSLHLQSFRFTGREADQSRNSSSQSEKEANNPGMPKQLLRNRQFKIYVSSIQLVQRGPSATTYVARQLQKPVWWHPFPTHKFLLFLELLFLALLVKVWLELRYSWQVVSSMACFSITSLPWDLGQWYYLLLGMGKSDSFGFPQFPSFFPAFSWFLHISTYPKTERRDGWLEPALPGLCSAPRLGSREGGGTTASN